MNRIVLVLFTLLAAGGVVVWASEHDEDNNIKGGSFGTIAEYVPVIKAVNKNVVTTQATKSNGNAAQYTIKVGDKNVHIDNKFTTQQRAQIESAVKSLDPVCVPDGLTFKQISGNTANGSSAAGSLELWIGDKIPLEYYGETALHEFAHLYAVSLEDPNNYSKLSPDLKAWEDLFQKSEQGPDSLDFCSNVPRDKQKGGVPANQTNSSEDFAYTTELYFRNSSKALTEAVNNADQGKTALLQKILLVMKLQFSQSDKVKYFKDGNQGSSISLSITESPNGDINSINGVNIKKSDGSYNVAGLRNILAQW